MVFLVGSSVNCTITSTLACGFSLKIRRELFDVFGRWRDHRRAFLQKKAEDPDSEEHEELLRVRLFVPVRAILKLFCRFFCCSALAI